MKLYLMRHGQASSPQVDPQQGLSSAGRNEVQQLAEKLVTKGVTFTKVLHSEKDRAQQTAAIMATHCTYGIAPEVCKGLKPNDDPRHWLEEIATWKDDTLIVSHLPFIPSLMNLLTNDDELLAFNTANIACLEQQPDGWKLEWFETP